MKVVLLVVILFVIWRWSCGLPMLACNHCSKYDALKHNCSQHPDHKNHSTDPPLVKRNVLTSFTDAIKNTTKSIGRKLHIIRKRTIVITALNKNESASNKSKSTENVLQNVTLSRFHKTNRSKERDADPRYYLVHDVPPCRKKRQLNDYEQSESNDRNSPNKGNRNITIIIQNLKERNRIKRESPKKNKTSHAHHSTMTILPKKKKTTGRKLLSVIEDNEVISPNRVKCPCAIFIYEPGSTATNPIFPECFLESHPENTVADRELMCFHICSEASKLYFVKRQMVLCTHIHPQGHFLQERPNNAMNPEMVFCQVIPRDEELALSYIISLLKVFLLDVTVCLSGLGVLCVYLICVAKHRKRLVPVYNPTRVSTK